MGLACKTVMINVNNRSVARKFFLDAAQRNSGRSWVEFTTTTKCYEALCDCALVSRSHLVIYVDSRGSEFRNHSFYS